MIDLFNWVDLRKEQRQILIVFPLQLPALFADLLRVAANVLIIQPQPIGAHIAVVSAGNLREIFIKPGVPALVDALVFRRVQPSPEIGKGMDPQLPQEIAKQDQLIIKWYFRRGLSSCHSILTY